MLLTRHQHVQRLSQATLTGRCRANAMAACLTPRGSSSALGVTLINQRDDHRIDRALVAVEKILGNSSKLGLDDENVEYSLATRQVVQRGGEQLVHFARRGGERTSVAVRNLIEQQGKMVFNVGRSAHQYPSGFVPRSGVALLRRRQAVRFRSNHAAAICLALLMLLLLWQPLSRRRGGERAGAARRRVGERAGAARTHDVFHRSG